MPCPASKVAAALAIATLSFSANAATSYSSPTPFFNSLGAYLTDDYQDTAYEHPDNPNGTFTDARMSAIFGETQYRTTGLADHSIVEHQPTEAVYCAGCNGSFVLDFTETSIGNASGVYGVSLHVIANQQIFPYVALVTYGDNTTESFSLPINNTQTPPPPTMFWGMTSSNLIKSIHFGGYDGAAVTSGGFAIDNLTIGSTLSADSDADGVQDSDDNCIDVPNGPLIPDAGGSSQRDSDGDGYGNLCDADLNNGGGVVNFPDLALFRAAFGTANANADLNGSGGVVNFADLAIFRSLFGKEPGPSGIVP